MVERALIVDSRFGSRKELLRELSDSGTVRNVQEAISVGDGLHHLESSVVEACIVGPTVSKVLAGDFIREGRAITQNRSCAFIVVCDETNKNSDYFLRVGADAIAAKPYERISFTDVVNRAIIASKERTEGHRVPLARDAIVEVLNAQKELGSVCVEMEGCVSEILREASQGLRSVAASLADGHLQIRPNGLPSLATRDAIRQVFLKALGPSEDVTAPDSFNAHFVNSLVDWFVERVDTEHNSATKRLKSKLMHFQLG